MMTPEIINHVEVAGVVGSRPKILYTQKNTEYINFSLSMPGVYVDAIGDPRSYVEWAHCSGYGVLIGVIVNLEINAGDNVKVIGQMRTKKYICKHTGIDKFITEVIIHKVELISRGYKSEQL